MFIGSRSICTFFLELGTRAFQYYILKCESFKWIVPYWCSSYSVLHTMRAKYWYAVNSASNWLVFWFPEIVGAHSGTISLF